MPFVVVYNVYDTFLWEIFRPRIPEGTVNGIGNDKANDIPNGIANGIPNGVPNGIPNGMPNGIVNGIADQPTLNLAWPLIGQNKLTAQTYRDWSTV